MELKHVQIQGKMRIHWIQKATEIFFWNEVTSTSSFTKLFYFIIKQSYFLLMHIHIYIYKNTDVIYYICICMC